MVVVNWFKNENKSRDKVLTILESVFYKDGPKLGRTKLKCVVLNLIPWWWAKEYWRLDLSKGTNKPPPSPLNNKFNLFKFGLDFWPFDPKINRKSSWGHRQNVWRINKYQYYRSKCYRVKVRKQCTVQTRNLTLII